MAASSTTSCASWPQPNMVVGRASLAAAVSFALALCGCAPDDEDKDDAPSVPHGFELAAAGAADSGAAMSAVVQDLSPSAVRDRIEAGNLRLIDIRRDDELALGMIPGAEHIPMEEFDPASVLVSDDRAIVLYCRSGRRSRIVGEQLAVYTGEPSSHLAGGIIAWEAAGLPVETPE